MTVSALGYIGYRTHMLDDWMSLATDILGMEARRGTTDAGEGVLLRLDERSVRLLLEPATTAEELAFVGWETASEEALYQTVRAIEDAGVAVKNGSETEARNRGVAGLVRFDDPAGTPTELFWGQHNEYTFRSPLDTRFVTGPLGLGHVVLLVPSFAETLDFYIRVLGFRVSDVTRVGPVGLTFLHCNARHHSLALGDGTQFEGMTSTLMHILVEVADQNEVGRGYDRCLDAKVPIGLTLGRHTNDDMFSFYLKTPSGFEIEYGQGGRLIDDATWTVTSMARGDHWGHRFADGSALNDTISL